MRVVVDLVFEKPAPFNPSEAIEEIVALLRRYKINSVEGDNYGAELIAEHFRKHGIEYHRSKRDRSEIYLEFMPLMRAGQVRLLDHAKAIEQFAALARRTLPGGKDRSIMKSMAMTILPTASPAPSCWPRSIAISAFHSRSRSS